MAKTEPNISRPAWGAVSRPPKDLIHVSKLRAAAGTERESDLENERASEHKRLAVWDHVETGKSKQCTH